MWTGAGQGRWRRDDGDDGYLIVGDDVILELHGRTVHTYRPDPNADPATFTGGPLDGYMAVSSEPVDDTELETPTPVGPAVAFRLLDVRNAKSKKDKDKAGRQGRAR